jgi:O-succinylbenzoate synthase
MRIDRLDVYYVRMPLIYPWRTAYGEDHTIDSVLVKATSDEYEGWAEATPFFAPHYVPECAVGVFHLVADVFGPHVVGREYDTAKDLNERLAFAKGNGFAKAAIELCWWTLESKISGTPVHKLLGGETRPVVAGADFGVQDSIDMLLGNIQQAVDAGFPRTKLKVRPGWDVDMLHAVHSAFPNHLVHIDCNSGYTLDDVDTFEAIDDLGLAFIEQPLGWNDILDHAELARRISTPICLDESARELNVVEQAIRIGACHYINIKPGRVGGFTNSVAMHDLCHDNGIPVWIGGMLESAVGASLCVELATLPNFTYPGDLFPSSRFYTEDLATPSLTIEPDLTFLPATEALPEPAPERLEHMATRHTSVTAE